MLVAHAFSIPELRILNVGVGIGSGGVHTETTGETQKAFALERPCSERHVIEELAFKTNN